MSTHISGIAKLRSLPYSLEVVLSIYHMFWNLNHLKFCFSSKRVTQPSGVDKAAPIKGIDETVSITVTRTPGKSANAQRQSGKPANFALLASPVRNGRNSDAIRVTPREEMVCHGCKRTFKYKAAFIRHEAQCGLPLALRIER